MSQKKISVIPKRENFNSVSTINSDEKAILTAHFSNVYLQKNKTKTLTDLKEIYNIKEKTITIAEEAYQHLLFEMDKAPFKCSEDYKFTFIDLFAGIGGFRLALQNIGGKCTYTSEWERYAQHTYFANYGEYPFGDITKDEIKNFIPEKMDIVCAGFPCQAFSIAGHQKGFSDTRGTLYFDIEQIILKHQPKVVFLENVKNLISHDSGNTFQTILNSLEIKLGYKVYYEVLNTATHANIPQNRERIFIVAFNPEKVPDYHSFQFPQKIKLTKTIHDFLEKGQQDKDLYYSPDHKYYPELSKFITSKETIYQWRRVYARENKNKLCPTLTANMGTGGHNVPLIKDDFGIRKLTPKECFAFQGFPMNKFILPSISKSKLYMQAGNSVTTTLIEKIAKQIIKVL